MLVEAVPWHVPDPTWPRGSLLDRSQNAWSTWKHPMTCQPKAYLEPRGWSDAIRPDHCEASPRMPSPSGYGCKRPNSPWRPDHRLTSTGNTHCRSHSRDESDPPQKKKAEPAWPVPWSGNFPRQHLGLNGLLHLSELRTPHVGGRQISLAVEENHCWVVELWFGGTDGWFDDPIELSTRAYILSLLNALGKSLLARHNLNPEIKLLTDPWAYVSPPYWSLLSITKPHSHAPLWHINSPAQHAYVLFSNWTPHLMDSCYPSVIPFMTLWPSHKCLMTLSWQRLCSIHSNRITHSLYY